MELLQVMQKEKLKRSFSAPCLPVRLVPLPLSVIQTSLVVTEFTTASACETKASRRQLLFFGLFLKNARHFPRRIPGDFWRLEWITLKFGHILEIIVIVVFSYESRNKNNIKLLIKIKSFRWCSEKTVHNSYFKQVSEGWYTENGLELFPFRKK